MRSPTLALLSLALLLAAPAAFAAPVGPTSTESGVATQKTKGNSTTTKKKTTTTKKKTTKTPAKPAAKRSTKRAKKRDDQPVVEKLLAKGVIGLHVGGSASYFECDCVGEAGRQEYDSVYGLAAGVYYDKALNPFLSYRGGLRYHAKGAGFEAGATDVEVTLTTAEIEAALLLRYSLNPFASLYLSFGGFAGFIFGSEATADGDKITGYDDNYSAVDYGLNIGGGAFIALSRSRGLMASVTLQYSHGLANIADTEGNALPDESDALVTRAVMLTAGLHF